MNEKIHEKKFLFALFLLFFVCNIGVMGFLVGLTIFNVQALIEKPALLGFIGFGLVFLFATLLVVTIKFLRKFILKKVLFLVKSNGPGM
jgi:Na+/melibiose symporter-like transporter